MSGRCLCYQIQYNRRQTREKRADQQAQKILTIVRHLCWHLKVLVFTMKVTVALMCLIPLLMRGQAQGETGYNNKITLCVVYVSVFTCIWGVK